MEVHQPGQADANLYAHVRGAALKNVDPLGLADDYSNAHANQNQTSAEAPATETNATDGVSSTAASSDGSDSPYGSLAEWKAAKASAERATAESATTDDPSLWKAFVTGLKTGLNAANLDQARQNSPTNYDDYTALEQQKHGELLRQCGASCSVYPGAQRYLSA